MKVAYVDSSVLVAIAFGEKGFARQVKRLQGFDRLVSSNLLEAELSLHKAVGLCYPASS